MILRNTICLWTLMSMASAVALAACADKGTGQQVTQLASPAVQPAARPPGAGKDGGGPGGGNSGVPGHGDTGLGNNLATPVVFAEGQGLTGQPVTDANGPIYANTGLRPTADEGLTITSLPFSHFVPDAEYQTTFDGITYYQQKTPNTWQPQWRDAAAGGAPAQATVDWSDNLVRQTWTTNSVVRVEVVLDDLLNTDVVYPNEPTLVNTPMTGFNMTFLEGSGKTEQWGTDGTTAPFNATIYSVCPRLQISKCQGEYTLATATCQGSWVEAINLWTHDALSGEGSSGLSAEVNVSGKLIYGYNWMLRQLPDVIDGVPIDKAGWWRIAFSIDDGGGSVACNVSLDNLYPTDLHAYYAGAADEEGATDPVLYEPKLTSSTNTQIDVLINANRGGGQPR